MEVTLNDVIRMTDSGTFDRGRRYFNTGHVLPVQQQNALFSETSAAGLPTDKDSLLALLP